MRFIKLINNKISTMGRYERETIEDRTEKIKESWYSLSGRLSFISNYNPEIGILSDIISSSKTIESIVNSNRFYCTSYNPPIQYTSNNYKKKEGLTKMLKIHPSIKDPILSYSKLILSNKVKFHFGQDFNITGSDIVDINKWIRKYYKAFDNVVHTGWVCITDAQFLFKIDNGTFVHCKVGKYHPDFNIDNNNRQINPSDMWIYIFGKRSALYIKELKEILKSEDSNKDYIYNLVARTPSGNSDTFKVTQNIFIRRSFDTLFFESDIQNKISNLLNNFFKDKVLYTSRNIPIKTGILLYGEPGTGKSSIASAIQSLIPDEKHCRVLSIDMSNFNDIDIADLTNVINNDQDNDINYIILLEDIDCVIKNRTEENIDKLNKYDNDVIYKLLQFLDSSQSPQNVIFIATTNYIEKLDSAITRAGRFDLILEITGLGEGKAIEMCKSFKLSNETIKELFIKEKVAFPVNQSTLQSYIIKYIKR